MHSTWIFAADDKHWLPLPSPGTLTVEQRKLWLDAATVRISRANLEQDPQALAVLRERCREALDSAPEGEACVYFPVMEPFVLTVQIDTVPEAEWSASFAQWQAEGQGNVSFEVTQLDHAALKDAARVMRVDREGTRVVFPVAFFGRAGDVGLIIKATTSHPMIAGQFAKVGADFFATFELSAEGVGG